MEKIGKKAFRGCKHLESISIPKSANVISESAFSGCRKLKVKQTAVNAKYKFILTLPYDYEIDSQYAIEGHVSWPNWSQADPVHYKGIFNTAEEAQTYASGFKVYKYILKGDYEYDSFEDAAGSETPPYYISIFDAEAAACQKLGISPGDTLTVHPEFTVEEAAEDPENDIPGGVYKYILHHNGQCLLDSIEENSEYFDSYEEAQAAAEETANDYDIETDELAYELKEIEIVDIRIEETD